MSSQSTSPDVVRRVLLGAQTVFARHGFARASMADVAAASGVARATLYLRFADKRALFETLAETLVNEGLDAAEGAWRTDAPLAENLAATILAKDLPLHRLLHATPHGASLLAVDADLTAHHARRLQDGFVRILRRRAWVAEERGADLEVFGGTAGLADFLATASGGLKHEVQDEGLYCAAVRRLCQVTARAAGEAATARPGSTGSNTP